MRPLVFVNLVLLAALLVVSAWLWPSLPEALPQHFGLDGTPDRWGGRSTWWWMPVLALVMTGFFAVIARWAMRNPGRVNMPGKDRLLALPPERQRPVLVRTADLLWFTNALTLLLFGVIQWSIYHTAITGPSQGLSVAVLLLAVGMGPMILLGLPWIDAELKRQTHAHQAESA